TAIAMSSCTRNSCGVLIASLLDGPCSRTFLISSRPFCALAPLRPCALALRVDELDGDRDVVLHEAQVRRLDRQLARRPLLEDLLDLEQTLLRPCALAPLRPCAARR